MELYKLPFDQYQRYATTKKIIDNYKMKNNIISKLKVLDVGGLCYTKEGAAWLPIKNVIVDDITVLDIKDENLEGYVKGDGTKLDFEDNYFDIVISNDTLEHIPSDKRDKFIEELIRVTKNLVLLTYPEGTDRNKLCEKILNEYIIRETKGENRMLEEHLYNGLPEKIHVLGKIMVENSYLSFGSGNTNLWLLMMFIKYYLQSVEDSEQLSEMLDYYFNKYISDYDYSLESNCYRTVLIISKNKQDSFEQLSLLIENIKTDKFDYSMNNVPMLFSELVRMKKENSDKEKYDKYQYDWTDITPQLKQKFLLQQSFKCNSYNLFSIGFLVATYNKLLKGRVKFLLRDDLENVLVEKNIDLSLFKDSSWVDISFPQVVNSKNRKFTFCIGTIEEIENGFSIYYSQKKLVADNVIINEQMLDGNLAFRTKVKQNNLMDDVFFKEQKNNYLEEQRLKDMEAICKANNDNESLKQQVNELNINNQNLKLKINEYATYNEVLKEEIKKSNNDREIQKEEIKKSNNDREIQKEEIKKLNDNTIIIKEDMIKTYNENVNLIEEINLVKNQYEELKLLNKKYRQYLDTLIHNL